MPDSTITIAEMADLRGAAESWMMDTCDIYGHSPGVSDAYGGYSVDPELVKQQNVPCYVESGAEHAQTRALLAKIENVQAFSVDMPANTDVEVGDHLIITSRSNLHLRVEGVMAPESWETDRRVVAIQEAVHVT